MCLYNCVNSVYVCEDDWLFNQVFKCDWKYLGFVMFDWGVVYSVVKVVMVGLDQQFVGECFDKEVYFDKLLCEVVVKGEVL